MMVKGKYGEIKIPDEIVSEVKNVVNCPVYVAEKGIEIKLSEFPF